VQRLNKWSKSSNFLLKRKIPLKMSVMTPSTASAVLKKMFKKNRVFYIIDIYLV
jgi:hypothetical protein